jgi:hypothetical protein
MKKAECVFEMGGCALMETLFFDNWSGHAATGASDKAGGLAWFPFPIQRDVTPTQRMQNEIHGKLHSLELHGECACALAEVAGPWNTRRRGSLASQRACLAADDPRHAA